MKTVHYVLRKKGKGKKYLYLAEYFDRIVHYTHYMGVVEFETYKEALSFSKQFPKHHKYKVVKVITTTKIQTKGL